MNGKKPIEGNNWTMQDLPNYGFKPFTYYKYNSKLAQWWYGIFGDTLFNIDREFNSSTSRMDYEDYFIYCDEMGYIDVYHSIDNKIEEHSLLYTGRRGVTLSDMFNAIKYHRRGIRLDNLEDELV